ncbi:hypothetical protein HX882_07670 [Pseudomonas gingeri]|uniref:Uncharacterized protein n=1 Tax=Pseudomonas gingeri TaxID=117681 RepID=A0A7Y8C1Z6_9PSED|nr:hypothetical protein [Pseudomonas gingeri]NWB95762.1 hypothetical protein [Pseudomonas gingeri]
MVRIVGCQSILEVLHLIRPGGPQWDSGPVTLWLPSPADEWNVPTLQGLPVTTHEYKIEHIETHGIHATPRFSRRSGAGIRLVSRSKYTKTPPYMGGVFVCAFFSAGHPGVSKHFLVSAEKLSATPKMAARNRASVIFKMTLLARCYFRKGASPLMVCSDDS